MLGDISDEEANELITSFCLSLRPDFVRREMVESQIFPVTHYIHTACYILYDQSHQYNILKEVASKISPEEIGKRSKCLGAPLNQLSFCSIAMLYLHGRAQVIYDNIEKKKAGDTDIVIEPESKKKETKFILDFWRRLSPNYLNDRTLTIDNKDITFLSDDYLKDLKDQMIPIGENNKEIITKAKQTIAHLTIYNFLAHAECRAGIFDHGPYYFEGNPNPVIFKEFQSLYAGDETFGLKLSEILPYKITKPAPCSDVIFGMMLKDMNQIEFNNWGTIFADPSDFTSNISSIGIWTKEPLHPKNLRYPNDLGTLKPLTPKTLDDLIDFAKRATKELYITFSKWSFIKKLILGTSLYANDFLALCTGYAGLENDFNWTWPFDFADDKPLKNDMDKERINWYIERLKPWKGGHPFLKRMFKRIKTQMTDPFYYVMRE